MIRILAMLLALSTLTPIHAAEREPQAVDLARYTGTWYEIARLEHFFQRNCARDVTATYTRDGDFIRVVNRCVEADGEEIVAKGRARVVDAPTNRRLKVGFLEIFGWWPFEGDYWILDIDPDYRWVLIGGPDRKYGWILSRTPTLDAATRADLDRRLAGLGYDVKDFLASPQSAR